MRTAPRTPSRVVPSGSTLHWLKCWIPFSTTSDAWSWVVYVKYNWHQRLWGAEDCMEGSRYSHRLWKDMMCCAAAGTLLVGIIAAAPMTAAAKGNAAADPYETCLRTGEAADGVMPAIEDCNRAELHRRDQELNRLYADLIHRLPSSQVRTLRDAERIWIQRRDRTCRE